MILKFQMEFGDALFGIAVDNFEDEAVVDVDVTEIEGCAEDALVIWFVGRKTDQLHFLGLDGASVDATEDLHPKTQLQQKIVETCLSWQSIAGRVSELIFRPGGDAEDD